MTHGSYTTVHDSRGYAKVHWFIRVLHIDFAAILQRKRRRKKKKNVSVLISFLGLICELIEKSTRRTFQSSRSKSFLSACGVVARHHLRSFNPTLVAVIWTSVRLQLFFKASHSILTRDRSLFVASVVLQDFIRSRYNRSALYLAVTLPCL